MKYTAFCLTENCPTVWIQAIEADTMSEATNAAIEECATAREVPKDDVFLMGMAAGHANILYWEDPREVKL